MVLYSFLRFFYEEFFIIMFFYIVVVLNLTRRYILKYFKIFILKLFLFGNMVLLYGVLFLLK